MSQSKLISGKDEAEWMDVLDRCGSFDVYHLPSFHNLAQKMNEGEARLFTYQNGESIAALPFLLRPVAEVTGLEASKVFDATSVYGYAGPITNVSPENENAEEFRKEFQKSLSQELKRLQVVALFNRLHPLIPATWLLEGMAEVVTLGPVVAIDLSLAPEEQQKQMSSRVRRDLRKAAKSGVQVNEVPFLDGIDDFIPIYNSTMQKNEALDYYFFPREYYVQLKEALGDAVKLYFAKFEGEIVTAAMFFLKGNIIHYHLSGTPLRHLKHSGLKVILDHVRIWGTENGYSWLNLGGGVNCREDSLLEFKCGFSKNLVDFQLAKLVTDPGLYSELNQMRADHEVQNGLKTVSSGYFPQYRRPVVPNGEAAEV